MYFDTNRILGTCDSLDAIKQTVFKILNTERYAYIIYSWNYGIELKDLFGQPVMYVCPEIERRVQEALLQDDRITAVDNFEFDTSKRGVVSVSFTVHTNVGDLNEEMVVNI
jgi:phage baseplate assembly protein W